MAYKSFVTAFMRQPIAKFVFVWKLFYAILHLLENAWFCIAILYSLVDYVDDI